MAAKQILIMVLCLSLMFGLSNAIPSLPNVYSGTVTYSGSPTTNLAGMRITATVGSHSIGELGEVESGNKYEVMVDPGDYTGEIIFYIGGVEAEPKATYEMGAFTTLDLTVDKKPNRDIKCGNGVKEVGEQCDLTDMNFATCQNVIGSGWTGTISCDDSCSFDITRCIPGQYCGDGSCNNGESCSSCSQDCGSCSSSSSSSSGGSSSSSSGGDSGGSGGGGGGGGIIVKKNTPKPNVTTATAEETQPTATENEETSELLMSPADLSETENDNSLTGASIFGQLGSSTMLYGGLILAVIAIAIVGGWLYFKPRKKKTNGNGKKKN